VTEVHLPRSLVALFPGTARHLTVEVGTPTGGTPDVAAVLAALESRVPGIWDRLVTAGPVLREHINVYVDGERATLRTPVTDRSVVHIIPAVSGGAPGADG
jgi:molybdopterin synthase sulfur carrier subunit